MKKILISSQDQQKITLLFTTDDKHIRQITIAKNDLKNFKSHMKKLGCRNFKVQAASPC